jgi:hypothetical protein
MLRDPAQKWQLAAAAFRHCELVLDALTSWPSNLGPQRESHLWCGYIQLHNV